jgi:LuxR family maltose regulon positive regulatory protein
MSYTLEGDLRRAVTIYRQAIDLGTSHGVGGQPVPATGLPHLHLASSQYAWNKLDEALHHAQQAVSGCTRWGHTSNLVDSYRVLACIQYARDPHADVATTLSAAEQVIEDAYGRSLHIGRKILGLDGSRYCLQVLRAYFWLQSGKVDAVARSVEQLVRQYHISDDDAFPYLLRPRLYLAQGNMDAALSLLASTRRRLEANNDRISWRLDALTLQACAFYAKGDLPEAMEILEHALLLGEPGNYIRTFVDAGAPMDKLLRQVASRGITSDYVARILAAFPAQARPEEESPVVSLVEPLSERETEVLGLIAADLSNQDIADALFISVNTVKTHVKRLYGKLYVNSRVQAIERARELGLL